VAARLDAEITNDAARLIELLQQTAALRARAQRPPA
jgi:hypothetical protein